MNVRRLSLEISLEPKSPGVSLAVEKSSKVV